jgi:hypothetical protein
MKTNANLWILKSWCSDPGSAPTGAIAAIQCHGVLEYLLYF